jgi:hypothetical protein
MKLSSVLSFFICWWTADRAQARHTEYYGEGTSRCEPGLRRAKGEMGTHSNWLELGGHDSYQDRSRYCHGNKKYRVIPSYAPTGKMFDTMLHCGSALSASVPFVCDSPSCAHGHHALPPPVLWRKTTCMGRVKYHGKNATRGTQESPRQAKSGGMLLQRIYST